jgi:hypothetical protein
MPTISRALTRRRGLLAVGLLSCVALDAIVLNAVANPWFAAYSDPAWVSSRSAFMQARQAWQSRLFDGYYLKVEFSISQWKSIDGAIPDFVTRTCELEVRVTDRAEQVIDEERNTCTGVVPRTIHEVFALFEQRATEPVGKLARRTSSNCYSSDDGYLDLVAADYHPQWGYPLKISNQPIPWAPGPCFTSLLIMPTASTLVPRYEVTVVDFRPQ